MACVGIWTSPSFTHHNGVNRIEVGGISVGVGFIGVHYTYFGRVEAR
jgi:hypothetical protein